MCKATNISQTRYSSKICWGTAKTKFLQFFTKTGRCLRSSRVKSANQRCHSHQHPHPHFAFVISVLDYLPDSSQLDLCWWYPPQLLISSRTVGSGPRALGYSNLATKTHPFVLGYFPTQTQISVAIFEVQRLHPDAGHVLEFSIRKTWSCLCKLLFLGICPRMAVGKSWQLDPKNGMLPWLYPYIYILYPYISDVGGIENGKRIFPWDPRHHSNGPPRARQPRRLGMVNTVTVEPTEHQLRRKGKRIWTLYK